ncbi:Aminopeptidase PepA-related protein [Candidatus Nitrotoga sp. BS]|uniref:hypothetical protein n=1 Tax=Candidatus Nitrotoga sp. BS TaxID=2890408 RepID=UPI001FA508C8|nr:hypothetical protein [Candidatus Nitrotoga sp. BS]CAH1210969.1 Aminopeptidase PepA-related protein [Candidatus Nitrotoga sp. BS]
MLDFSKDVFTIQTQVRKSMQLFLAETPESIAIAALGDATQRKLAVYGAWVNGALLLEHKKKDKRKLLQ